MTLDYLKERWFKAIERYAVINDDPFDRDFWEKCAARDRELDHHASLFERSNAIGHHKHPDEVMVWRAAKTYVVARDEGMDAAMLWKLANE